MVAAAHPLAAQTSDAASCAFNESVSLRLEGDLDIAALEAAVNDVIARHDALRLRFTSTGDRMRVAAPSRVQLMVTQLANAAAFMEFTERDAETPFDLVGGPVARPALLRLSEQLHGTRAGHTGCSAARSKPTSAIIDREKVEGRFGHVGDSDGPRRGMKAASLRLDGCGG